jgi:transcriptional regulator GlxA family with amidase domain
MVKDSKASLSILVVVMPNFNLAATVSFIDPFRAATYLEGRTHFRWGVASIPGAVVASTGMTAKPRRYPQSKMNRRLQLHSCIRGLVRTNAGSHQDTKRDAKSRARKAAANLSMRKPPCKG